jgi:hypothetical protein
VHEFTNTITGDTARANVRTIIAFGRLISNATTCGECQNDHCIKRIKDEDCRRLRPTMLFVIAHVHWWRFDMALSEVRYYLDIFVKSYELLRINITRWYELLQIQTICNAMLFEINDV